MCIRDREYNIEAYGLTAVRKLNASGNDILRYSMPLGELAYTVRGQFAGPSRIVDVYAGENGMFSILDANRGRVFTYEMCIRDRLRTPPLPARRSRNTAASSRRRWTTRGRT